MRSNEDYDFWLRAAIAGFPFARNDRPLGLLPRPQRQPLGRQRAHAARHPARLPQARPTCSTNRRAELAILEQQIKRFETELLAAEARLRDGDRATSRRRASTSGRCTTRTGGATRPRTLPGALGTGTLNLARLQMRPHTAAVTGDRRARDAMKYSVVIATYNRAADLRDTLDSLAALQPDGPWEVLVVDNNSTDDTRQRRRECGADVSRARSATSSSASQGRSPALNAGIGAATRRHHRHDRRRRARASRIG